MAQKTALSVMALPGRVLSFTAKAEATIAAVGAEFTVPRSMAEFTVRRSAAAFTVPRQQADFTVRGDN
jgi:hypothetical protein